MASQSETITQMQSFLERLMSSARERDSEFSLFVPFFLGFTGTDPDMTRPDSAQNTVDPDHNSSDHTSPDGHHGQNQRERIIMINPFIRGVTHPGQTGFDSGRNSGDPDHNSSDNSSPDDNQGRNRIVMINPLTRGMVVIEGVGVDSLFRGVQGKDGPPPASKSSIDAMPRVEIGEGEEGECVICLDEWEKGITVKEMPCKHRFHEGCIEKWLGLHGSCPVCRFKMPVEDEPGEKGEERREEEIGREEREIWVRFLFANGRSRRGEESNEGGLNESGSSDPDSEPGSVRGELEEREYGVEN